MQASAYNTSLDLWACARTPELTPALAQLLRDAVPPDDRNDFGETALHVAATHGNDKAVQLLLCYNADLLVADWESRWTPLHRSFYHQHLSTSLFLLRHAVKCFGKIFLRKYLHETFDHAQQSPMELLTARLHKNDFKNTAETCVNDFVYSFGKRDYQLGYHLPNADVQMIPRLVELPANSPIIQLSANKYHTIALSAVGECFVWGFGKGGRLGTGDEFDRIEPTRLASLATTPIKKVVAGENHTMALSRIGQVFSWGSNSFSQLGHLGKSISLKSHFTPKRINAFRLYVVADIAASGCHSAAVDADDGAVYSWGSNRWGQLGRKEGCGTDQADATPRSVDALRPLHPMSVLYGKYDSVRAEKIALSDRHTCVVLRCSHNGCSIGQVWQFGDGSYRPSRVNFPSDLSNSGVIMCDKWMPTCKQRDMDMVDVSCAQNHSIALSSSGSVFTWRHNAPALSQQPNGSSRDRRADTSRNTVAISLSSSAPQKVLLSKYGPVNSVCASHDFCAVVTQQGDLVTWDCGQQGHERKKTWQPSPKRVAGVKKAVSVVAGHQHTAVLVVPVCPDFDSTADVTSMDVVASLVELVEKTIAAHVNVDNCALVWHYAERYAALRLQRYCLRFMQNNWDAILDASGQARMDTFFEIMLPPMEKLVAKKNSVDVAPIDKWKNRAKKKRAVKISRSLPTLVRKDESVAEGYNAENLYATLPAMLSKRNGQRKQKNNKFAIPVSFLSDTTFASTPHGISSPWGLHARVEEQKPLVSRSLCASSASQVSSSSPTALHAFLKAFPLPKSSICNDRMNDYTSRQRKGRIGGHESASSRSSISPKAIPKRMLGYDGIEREKVTAFTLDAFLKQPACRNARGKRSTLTASIWNSSFTDSAVATKQESLPLRTLKEIQIEEETAAAREREVKARLGSGTVLAQQSQSTVNSWGLFRPPDHVSLADVQKLQEKQQFIEQQRQILADIEREHAEKCRAAAAALVGGQNKQMTATEKRVKKAYKRERRTANTAAGCNVSTTAASGCTDHYQSRQNKLKKSKRTQGR